MKKRWIIYCLVLLVLLGGMELFLRNYFGFCNAVLMREDPDYEYIAVANQHRFRFRDRIIYNAYSMRSSDVDQTAVKILGFGDSIINGGVLTDQDSLATTMLTDSLSRRYNRKIQFLNISAGSWGPDNCFAYLNKHGDFGASEIFLFVNSHDAYDNINFRKIVGIDENFPDKQYKLALVELFDRYLFPMIRYSFIRRPAKTNPLGINKKTNKSKFNTGFQAFVDYAKSHNIPMTFYLHAELVEFRAGKYKQQGQEIIEFAKANNIRLIQDLFNGLKADDFRDDIHLSAQGQRRIVSNVLKYGLLHAPTPD